MIQKPGFIFFDLGNVILNFSHQRSFEQVAEVANISPEKAKEAIFDSGLQNQYEKGLVTSDQFVDIFSKETVSQPDPARLFRALSDIFWLNRSIVPILAGLRGINYPMGILSNTCEAHWLFALERFPVIPMMFNQFILSYESKSMKPDAKIYEDAIAMAGLPPQQIFFVDDRPENVEGAKAAGLDAHIFYDSVGLSHLLAQRDVRLNV